MLPILHALLMAAPAQEPAPLAALWDDGFVFRTADGNYELTLGALLQSNLVAFPGGAPGRASEAELRRMRLEIGGLLDGAWRFNLEPNFAADGVEMEEAWLGADLPGGALLMIGRMKEPFGMEEMLPRKRQDFPEFSLLNRWSPAEDHGVTLFGDAAQGRVWYGVAAYNGSGGDEVNDDKDLAARLAWRPWGAPADDGARSFLQFAANATYGVAEQDLAGAELFQDARQAFAVFEPGARLDGPRTRLGADFTWLTGPSAVMAELFHVESDVVGSGGSGSAATSGWLLSASRVLTGEARGWKGIHPRRPLHGEEPGSGAWQVAARWSELRLGAAWQDLGLLLPASYPGTVRGLDLGLNWYPTRRVAWRLHFLHNFYAEDLLLGGSSVSGESAVILQLQFAF